MKMLSSPGARQIALNAPLVLFLALALVVPLLGIIAFSFGAEPHLLSNYAQVVSSRTYMRVIGMTLLLGIIVAAVTTVMAFLFSLWVLNLRPRWKPLVIACIVLPFFISYLVRALS